MTKENPPISQEGVVEQLHHEAEITAEELQNKQEAPSFIETPEDKERNLTVAKMEAETAYAKSKNTQERKLKGDDVWTMPKMDTKPHSKLRNAYMGARIALAGLLGLSTVGAKAHEGTPNDSTKNKVESVAKKESKETVTNEIRSDWNKYIEWLRSKKLAGDQSLDHKGKGVQLLQDYMKEHPETTISLEKIDDIQEEFKRYREWSLNEIKAGRSAFSEGVSEKNYMTHLSDADGIPGQYTTRHSFPESYMLTFENGTLIKTEHRGFAGTNKKDSKTVNYSDIAKTDKK